MTKWQRFKIYCSIAWETVVLYIVDDVPYYLSVGWTKIKKYVFGRED